MAHVAREASVKTGVDLIDRHHQRIIAHINRLHQCLNKGESEEVLAILEDVIEFTTSQFADEEHQLAINAFPQLEQHKRVHESFSRRLKEYRRVLQVGYNETIAKKLLSDMRIWLTDHILRDDCAYLSLFAQNRGRNWVTRALGRFINH